MQLNYDGLVIMLGDVHGCWTALRNKIKHYDLSDCLIICVGDLGIGFCKNEKKEEKLLADLESFFAARNIQFWSLVGNHDAPYYWDGHIDRKNLKLIPNYTTGNINGKKWLFVGGAVSIDRIDRTCGVDYWPDEVFILDLEKLPEDKIDVLITHSAPSWIGPTGCTGIVKYYVEKEGGNDLWDTICKERQDHDKLFEIVKPAKSFIGHFHTEAFAEKDGCKARILGELQMVEFT